MKLSQDSLRIEDGLYIYTHILPNCFTYIAIFKSPLQSEKFALKILRGSIDVKEDGLK